VSGGVNESTSRETLRQLVIAALLRQTDAGPHVYAPDDVPVQHEEMPSILVETPNETKSSRGRMGGIPQFLTIATVTATGYVEATSAIRAKAQIDRLTKQMERCVLTSNDIIVSIQQFTEVRSSYTVTADGQMHNGIGIVQFDMEFPQEFYPEPPTYPLESVVLDADLANRFDAAGTYSPGDPGFNADFPNSAVPAPRSSGPDGRLEGRIKIDLPQ
jgi:hypothetical protein